MSAGSCSRSPLSALSEDIAIEIDSSASAGVPADLDNSIIRETSEAKRTLLCNCYFVNWYKLSGCFSKMA